MENYQTIFSVINQFRLEKNSCTNYFTEPSTKPLCEIIGQPLKVILQRPFSIKILFNGSGFTGYYF